MLNNVQARSGKIDRKFRRRSKSPEVNIYPKKNRTKIKKRIENYADSEKRPHINPKTICLFEEQTVVWCAVGANRKLDYVFRILKIWLSYFTSLNIMSISFRCYNLLMLVTLLIGYSSSAQGASTSWVRQSQAPFNVEKEFQKFGEDVGGNFEEFKFPGSSVSSLEKNAVWSKPSTGSSHIQHHDIFKTGEPSYEEITYDEQAQDTALDDDEVDNRVPRSFYVDIFDASLPVDSPYRKSMRQPQLPPQQGQPYSRTPTYSNSIEDPSHFSNSIRPFSNEFISTSIPQNIRGLKNFAFQRMGWKHSSFSNEVLDHMSHSKLDNRGTSILRQFMERKPVSDAFEKLPFHRETSGRFGSKRDGSFEAGKKDVVPIFTSTYYHRPGSSEPARGSVWLGFPRPALNSGRNDELHTKKLGAVTNDDIRGENNGCHDDQGVWRRDGEVWYGEGCTRHKCVAFRRRHFIEVDSCHSEIHNTSYRCIVRADAEAKYPRCCPRFECHADNLGRPGENFSATQIV
ncbi:uncharacterized protein LOC108665002 isoform X2 [Hyalella azteca]|uniref:Uncharacterized protein LOC108665002 isoform X2 n=1 Tax=Hyalella azteca TaxID=294128 RepID=A0A979FSD4_HYAAZ|nr:uncharacterized protein LOC108665002 isoform X2 [Hyalella azteca]